MEVDRTVLPRLRQIDQGNHIRRPHRLNLAAEFRAEGLIDAFTGVVDQFRVPVQGGKCLLQNLQRLLALDVKVSGHSVDSPNFRLLIKPAYPAFPPVGVHQ